MLHNFIVLSSDPLAKIFSLGLIATDNTKSLWLENVVISFYVSTFQSLIVLSSDPLARIVPVLLKTTEVI